MAEAFGSVLDFEGVATTAQAVKALAYGSASAYGIAAYPAQQATGSVTFATSFTSSPPAASQDIDIPSGTIVATAGGAQYQTTIDTTISVGGTGATASISALIGGAAGNAPADSVTQILSNIGYPLYVNNAAPITNGASAEAPSVTLARLAAAQAKLGLCSPTAVANACVGVRGSGGTVCQFASCWEPWITAGSGSGSGTAGFTVFIDDGSGGAQPDLISACAAYLLGSAATNTSGYRPAGVPYTVSGVTPIYANVGVTGTLLPSASPSQVAVAVQTQVQNYFAALQITNTAAQSQIAAAAADAGLGYFSSLTVSLTYASGGSSVPSITCGPPNRVILSTLTVSVS
jgi:hypothetical protein